MNSTLAEEVRRDSKDGSTLNKIQGFLENCYKQSSLEAAVQRLSRVVRLQEQAGLCLNQARLHCDRAREIVNDDSRSDDDKSSFLGEVEKCHLSIQDYQKVKTSEFEQLKDIVDEFWSDFPAEIQKAFEAWAKDLAIRVAQEAEEAVDQKYNLALQELLESIPTDWAVMTEEVMGRLKQLIHDKSYENLIKSRLAFIGSVFSQEVACEDSLEEPVANIYLKGGDSPNTLVSSRCIHDR